MEAGLKVRIPTSVRLYALGWLLPFALTVNFPYLLTPHCPLLPAHCSLFAATFPLTPHCSLFTPHSSLFPAHCFLLTPHSWQVLQSLQEVPMSKAETLEQLAKT